MLFKLIALGFILKVFIFFIDGLFGLSVHN